MKEWKHAHDVTDRWSLADSTLPCWVELKAIFGGYTILLSEDTTLAKQTLFTSNPGKLLTGCIISFPLSDQRRVIAVDGGALTLQYID
jgi:hypothetical protein